MIRSADIFILTHRVFEPCSQRINVAAHDRMRMAAIISFFALNDQANLYII